MEGIKIPFVSDSATAYQDCPCGPSDLLSLTFWSGNSEITRPPSKSLRRLGICSVIHAHLTGLHPRLWSLSWSFGMDRLKSLGSRDSPGRHSSTED